MLNAAVTAPGRARGALVGVAAALVLFPLCSRGPLAGASLLSWRAHRAVDALLVTGLVAGAAAGAGRLDWVSVAVLAGVAGLLSALSLLTRYQPAPVRAQLAARRPWSSTDSQRLASTVAHYLGGAVGRARATWRRSS